MEEEKKVLLEELYRPPAGIQEFIFDVYAKLMRWRTVRDNPYKQYNQQSCTDYWQDSRQKFWGFLPISSDADTPQFFFPETRNQVIGILSKIANLRMKPSFEGVEGFDLVKATLLKDLFEHWRRMANRKITNFWQFFYTVVNGTCIVFTAYNNKKRKVKNITMHDPDTGKTAFKEEELDESDVEDTICNLEDIYIPKIWEPNMQQQDELIWKTLMKWDDFKNAFKNYTNVSFVVPGNQFADSSIFAEFLSYDVKGSEFVEVIKYFNVPEDQYAIIANGVLLNPIKNESDEEEVCPLPWNHKKLPFSKTIFEPLEPNFFYGMPLPQKVKSPQEALNKMWELYLEREVRAIGAPILTNDPSMEFGLEMKPGRFYQVQGDPVNQYRELQISGASPSFQNALNNLVGIIQRTGSGGTFSSPPSKQPRTATEAAQVAQQREETGGLYFLFYQDLLEQKVWLTLKNIIQFYTAEKTEKIIGTRKFLKIISLTETKLFGGGMGNHEIRITETPASADELRKEAYLRSLIKKERVEIIEVTPQALQQLNFDIKIGFEVENSPEMERALYLDYVTTLVNLFAPTGLLSMKKLLYRTVEKFNEQISDVVEENISADYENERFGIGAQPHTVPPATNDINQQMRGQMFGAAGAGQRMVNQGQAPSNILRKF